jgi:Putative zinc-finger
MGFGTWAEVTNDSAEQERRDERHFQGRPASYRVDKNVPRKVKILEIDCYEVRRELVNYMEEDLEPELRDRIDAHLRNCHHCTAVYDGVRNVVHLLGSEESIELPAGFSQRLYKRLLFRVQ